MTMVSGERMWVYDDMIKNVNTGPILGTTAMVDDVVVYLSQHGVTMARMEHTESLHIKSIPIGETVRRITKLGNYIIIVCSKTEKMVLEGEQVQMPGGFGKSKVEVEYREKASLKVVDVETYDILDIFDLDRDELGSCVCTATVDGEEFVFVGTGVMDDEEEEPTRGRVLVFAICDGRFEMKGEVETNGCVYSIVGFQGKVVVSIGNKVGLYRWSFGGGEMESEDGCEEMEQEDGGRIVVKDTESCKERRLELVCIHYGHILVLHLSVDNDDILVTDLMKSVSILRYDESTHKLVERHRDPETHWMTTAEIKDDMIIGCDASYNLFVTTKQTNVPKLDHCGWFQMGDQVNKLKKGRLCSGSEMIVPMMVYVTVNGEIGMISMVHCDREEMLVQIEMAMSLVIVHPFHLSPVT
jgi:DNA damage-binding protein 1